MQAGHQVGEQDIRYAIIRPGGHQTWPTVYLMCGKVIRWAHRLASGPTIQPMRKTHMGQEDIRRAGKIL